MCREAFDLATQIIKLHLPGQHEQKHHGRRGSRAFAFGIGAGTGALVAALGTTLMVRRARTLHTQSAMVGAFTPSLRHHFAKNGMFYDHLSSDATVRIHTVERMIRPLRYETAYLFDQYGRRLGQNTGGAHSVEISTDMQLAALRNSRSILTHNHPINAPLTLNDLILATSLNLKEIRAITSDSTIYRMVRADRGWPPLDSVVTFARETIPKSWNAITRDRDTQRLLKSMNTRGVLKEPALLSVEYLIKKQNVWLLKKYLEKFGGILLIEKL